MRALSAVFITCGSAALGLLAPWGNLGVVVMLCLSSLNSETVAPLQLQHQCRR